MADFLFIKTSCIHSADLVYQIICSYGEFTIGKTQKNPIIWLNDYNPAISTSMMLMSLNISSKTRTITLILITPLSYLMQLTGVNC